MKYYFDHPCRQTCSGWHNGYNTGLSITLKRQQAIQKMVEALEYSLDPHYTSKIRFECKKALEAWRQANESN